MSDVCDNPRRLLLVDDDDLVRRSIRLVVRRVSTHLEECREGQQALDAARRETPGGVLLDLGLPDIGGLEVLAALKHEMPEVPVVVVSGASSIEDALEAMKQGADDFITKPFLPERLLAAVRNVLKVSDLQGRIALLESAMESGTAAIPGALMPLHEVERKYVAYVVDCCGGDLGAAARALGIGAIELHRLLERHGLLLEEAR